MIIHYITDNDETDICIVKNGQVPRIGEYVNFQNYPLETARWTITKITYFYVCDTDNPPPYKYADDLDVILVSCKPYVFSEHYNKLTNFY